MNEEELKNDYRKKRQLLEEQEDSIADYKRKGEQAFHEMKQNLRYQLQDFALDGEPFSYAQRAFDKDEEEFYHALDQERKTVLKKQEETDETYYRELKRVMEDKKN